MSALAPPFSYFGGKTTLAGRIADLLPPHGHYVEPFAGSLAVLLAKPRSAMETVNDLDGDLMTFWRVLRDRPEDLARVCTLTPHSRAEFLLSRDRDGIDDLEIARRVWVGLAQGRSGRLTRTGWRYCRTSKGPQINAYLATYVGRIIEDAARLVGVSLECLPALDVIRRYGSEPDTLIYADPPYLASTRGWGNNYRVEMRTEVGHVELAEALRSCAGPVILSGYASPLYDEDLYADWERLEIRTTTGNGGANRDRVEVLWSNRPLGHDRLDFGGIA